MSWQEIACAKDGIVFVVKATDRLMRVGAPRFDQVEFIAYRDDLRGSVSCGARTPPDAVYVTWRENGPPKTEGLVVAIEFLARDFTP